MAGPINREEAEQIGALLSQRANEIAGYSADNREGMPESVLTALSREVARLRDLASRVVHPVVDE